MFFLALILELTQKYYNASNWQDCSTWGNTFNNCSDLRLDSLYTTYFLEEDQAPVIQLWDLRFATSPLKTLENHQRGVLSIDWCTQDSSLLVSCGKDNRILCWDLSSSSQSGEVLAEIARTNQWNFDIAWCPKNPNLIASPGFDGHVSVYSLMGGTFP